MPSNTTKGSPEEKGEGSSITAEEPPQKIEHLQQQIQNETNEGEPINSERTDSIPHRRPQKRGRADTEGQSVDVAYTALVHTSSFQGDPQEQEMATEEHQSSQGPLPILRYEVNNASCRIQFRRADGSMGERTTVVSINQLSPDGEGIRICSEDVMLTTPRAERGCRWAEKDGR